MNNRQIVYVILFAVSTMSCGVYHPQMVDIPLINKKGDARLNSGISLLQFHGTVSVGITDNVAIQTFASTRGNHQYYVQEALGYFKDLGNKKVMELYSGFGYAYGDAYYDPNPGNIFGNYQVYFSQFNFGKTDCDFAHADFGFGWKTGYLHSKLTDRNYYARNYPPIESAGIYKDDCLLLEPQIFIRIGEENVKFNLQIGSIRIIKFTNKDKWFPSFPLNIGFGLNYKF